jgi:PIN domain nuclease of toxin-antitoxin system
LRVHRFTALDITSEHALAVEMLPPHHRDPFDRMLVAQARLEKLTLVTHDPRLRSYDVPLIET